MKEFTTSDLNLAAALMSEGYLLVKSEPDSTQIQSHTKFVKYLFTIGCSQDVYEKFQRDLLNGVLMVNLKEFLYRVKHLKGIIYGRA